MGGACTTLQPGALNRLELKNPRETEEYVEEASTRPNSQYGTAEIYHSNLIFWDDVPACVITEHINGMCSNSSLKPEFLGAQRITDLQIMVQRVLSFINPDNTTAVAERGVVGGVVLLERMVANRVELHRTQVPLLFLVAVMIALKDEDIPFSSFVFIASTQIDAIKYAESYVLEALKNDTSIPFKRVLELQSRFYLKI